MRYFLNGLPLVVLALATALSAGEPAPAANSQPPAEAKSIDEIDAAINRSKGFGTPASAHFRRPERELFATWYCPYSGRDATKLHVYEFDAERKFWKRVLDTQFENTHDLSLELLPGEGGLVVRDVRGKVIYREHAAK